MKMESIKFNEFLSGEYQLKVKKIKEVKKGRIYKIILVSGLTLIMLHTGFDTVSFAAGTTGIDQGAYDIYRKLLKIGKWIIICKGGIDTINSMMQGDHGAAKKGFLTYLVVYLILNGLPWAMDQVDVLFKGLGNPASGVAQ